MSETVGRGTSRARYVRRSSKHAQRTPLPPRQPVRAPLVRAAVAEDGQVRKFVEFCACTVPRLSVGNVCGCGTTWIPGE